MSIIGNGASLQLTGQHDLECVDQCRRQSARRWRLSSLKSDDTSGWQLKTSPDTGLVYIWIRGNGERRFAGPTI